MRIFQAMMKDAINSCSKVPGRRLHIQFGSLGGIFVFFGDVFFPACHIYFASSGSACQVNPWMLAQKKRIPVKRECWRLEMAGSTAFLSQNSPAESVLRFLSDTQQLFKKSSRSVRQNIYPKRPAECRVVVCCSWVSFVLAQTFSSECASSFQHFHVNDDNIYDNM